MTANSVSSQLVVQLQPGDDPQVITVQIEQILAKHREAMKSIARVQEVRNTQQRIGGWTQSTFDQFILLLASTYPTHVDAIRMAAKLGGAIPRDRLLALFGRTADRQLNGITRPIKRTIEQMQKQGITPLELDDPFEPRYPDGSGKADRFVVPDRLIQLVLNSPSIHSEL